ncbi:MAG: hypothetical protein JJU12_02235 [Chlamydiales bacterium]|nr:hypothetical protein [Chlamydiales bacterium]
MNSLSNEQPLPQSSISSPQLLAHNASEIANEDINKKIEEIAANRIGIYYANAPTEEHFNLLNKALQNLSEKLDKDNLTKNDFDWITSQYMNVLQLMLNEQGKAIISNLISLTYYESETESNQQLSSLKFEDPCFLTLLLRNFLISSMLPEDLFQLSKNIKFCLKVLSWIKLSVEYLPAQQQEQALHNLCTIVLDKLNEMRLGEIKLLPGGWCNVDQIPGHFMLYLIKRIDINNYTITRINSHFYSDSQCGEIRINHDQLLNKISDLPNFVQDLFSLQFPTYFKNLKIHLLETKQKLDYCDKYCPQTSEAIFMEGQKNMPNCTFMAYNAFLIYLKNSKSLAENFKISFREYLKELVNT